VHTVVEFCTSVFYYLNIWISLKRLKNIMLYKASAAIINIVNLTKKLGSMSSVIQVK